MIKKVKEIVDAWVIATNPSPEQLKLAEARLNVCNGCEYIGYGKKGNPKCNECGCPLQKKIFSAKHDACPLHKWIDVENSNLYKDTQKINKTIL
jgi:hypothetical protein